MSRNKYRTKHLLNLSNQLTKTGQVCLQFLDLWWITSFESRPEHQLCWQNFRFSSVTSDKFLTSNRPRQLPSKYLQFNPLSYPFTQCYIVTILKTLLTNPHSETDTNIEASYSCSVSHEYPLHDATRKFIKVIFEILATVFTYLRQWTLTWDTWICFTSRDLIRSSIISI